LKTGLFQNSEALVGIYRDQGANSSKALTLDVSVFVVLCAGCSSALLTVDKQLRKYQ
jgi:hypothetical protein